LALFNVVGALTVIPDRGGDFTLLYDSTVAWLRGLPPYVSSQPTTNLNHPVMWLVVAPFTLLPNAYAFVAWTVLSLIALVLVIRAIETRLRLTTLDSVVVVLSLTGTAFGLALGQVSSVMLIPFTAAWLAARCGRSTVEGACLGALFVLKPFFCLFGVMLLLRRRWRALIASGLVAALMMALGWMMAGNDGMLTWLDNFRHVSWTGHIFNGSVWGVGSRLFHRQPISLAATWTPLTESPVMETIVGGLGTAAVVIALWRLRRSVDDDLEYAAVALASLLISPLGWNYYLAVVFGPVIAVLTRRPASSWLWLLGVLAACPPGLLVGRHYGQIGTLVVGQLSVTVFTCLLVLVLFQREDLTD
jgi:hypothetical protein